MRILTLDCATTTGWAYRDVDGDVQSGTHSFREERGESRGAKFLRFRAWLEEILDTVEVDLVVYEQAHQRGGAATEVCIGMATRVQEICAGRGIDYVKAHASRVKKHVAGAGNASKEEVRAGMVRRFGVHPEVSLDESDALALMAWAIDSFAAERAA